MLIKLGFKSIAFSFQQLFQYSFHTLSGSECLSFPQMMGKHVALTLELSRTNSNTHYNFVKCSIEHAFHKNTSQFTQYFYYNENVFKKVILVDLFCKKKNWNVCGLSLLKAWKNVAADPCLFCVKQKASSNFITSVLLSRMLQKQ